MALLEMSGRPGYRTNKRWSDSRLATAFWLYSYQCLLGVPYRSGVQTPGTHSPSTVLVQTALEEAERQTSLAQLCAFEAKGERAPAGR